jgi:hypothetical protein
VLIDLPASLSEIREGEFCSDVTPRGKPGPHAAHGARQGIRLHRLVCRYNDSAATTTAMMVRARMTRSSTVTSLQFRTRCRQTEYRRQADRTTGPPCRDTLAGSKPDRQLRSIHL